MISAETRAKADAAVMRFAREYGTKCPHFI